MSNQHVDEHLSSAMRLAATEARRWLGATAPNPPVGAAILDAEGQVLAVAAHRQAGTDHAEPAALLLCQQRGLMPRAHTLCVTLEPCNHTGRTPPCSEAIIASRMTRVAIGLRDPNPRVAGGGVERLRQAGIEVIENVEPHICAQLAHAWLYHARYNKPFVTVKRAFDAAGSMIPPAGQKTFTSPESLSRAHGLRKKADAIVTGSGTVLADNPLFTVRHVPDHAGKRRILAILDRRGRISPDYIAAAAQRGLDAVIYRTLDACFKDLSQRGIQDILVESGPILSASILDSPHWTMTVDIHAATPDTVRIAFNPKTEIPFDANHIEIDSLLPL